MNDEKAFLADLQQELDRRMNQLNTTPNHEIDNLSPNDMYIILYYTFGEDSPVGFRKEVSKEVLDKIPFLRLVEAFLGEIEKANELKLTARGNLPKKLCLELYSKKIVLEDAIEKGIVKLSKEGDSIVLGSMKYVCLMSGLVKKRNNKISLTQKGRLFLAPKKRYELLKLLFETHCKKFNLGYFDGYPQEVGIQKTIGYTIYLLLRYGKEKRKIEYYVNKNIQAFPHELNHFEERWSSKEKQYLYCYEARIYNRFLEYYGVVDYHRERRYGENENNELQTTEIFDEIFELRKDKFRFIKNEHCA